MSWLLHRVLDTSSSTSHKNNLSFTTLIILGDGASGTATISSAAVTAFNDKLSYLASHVPVHVTLNLNDVEEAVNLICLLLGRRVVSGFVIHTI